MQARLHPPACGVRGHSDTVGRPLAGTEVYAVDAEGRRLPPGETGELVVRGRHVALGYWRAPAETERRFRKRAPESAVELFTGDSGSVDAGGYIRFSARSDDWIKHRGHRLSPLEIESEACQIEGVVEASLLQREEDDTLHLFVTVSDPSLEPGDVQRALGRTLEPAKIPDRVLILPEMPKSLNGKIDRKALVAGLPDDGPPIPMSYRISIVTGSDAERREIAAFLAAFVRDGELLKPRCGDDDPAKWEQRMRWWWDENPHCLSDSPRGYRLDHETAGLVGFSGSFPSATKRETRPCLPSSRRPCS